MSTAYLQNLVDLQQDLRPKNQFVSRRYRVSRRCLTLYCKIQGRRGHWWTKEVLATPERGCFLNGYCVNTVQILPRSQREGSVHHLTPMWRCVSMGNVSHRHGNLLQLRDRCVKPDITHAIDVLECSKDIVFIVSPADYIGLLYLSTNETR